MRKSSSVQAPKIPSKCTNQTVKWRKGVNGSFTLSRSCSSTLMYPDDAFCNDLRVISTEWSPLDGIPVAEPDSLHLPNRARFIAASNREVVAFFKKTLLPERSLC